MVFYNPEEQAWIRHLANLFEQGQTKISQSELRQMPGIDPKRIAAMMGLLQEHNFIQPLDETIQGSYLITSVTVQVVREIDRQEQEARAPQDIVEQVKAWARRNPWIAWPIIIIVAATVLLTLFNGVFQAIKNLRGL